MSLPLVIYLVMREAPGNYLTRNTDSSIIECCDLEGIDIYWLHSFIGDY